MKTTPMVRGIKPLWLASLLLVLTASTCRNHKTLPPGYYKGRLEIKGACMNYTIALLEGSIDTTRISPSWTDESTGRSYKNVFALGSRCQFPSRIRQGDTFYFTVDSTIVQNCMVCMIYYPVPPKRLFIRVVDKPGTP
ncbi:MAG: hypothetical protein ACXVMS_04935 [Flavisolibacter sp.]